jgi:hypothetical protein
MNGIEGPCMSIGISATRNKNVFGQRKRVRRLTVMGYIMDLWNEIMLAMGTY